ncbi:hypothetical protein C2E23DRAFT_900856 [Lenzites betulinus]|nr:hypothetical protein C2E23DRAFT_900856 [Lenzites betulinus]
MTLPSLQYCQYVCDDATHIFTQPECGNMNIAIAQVCPCSQSPVFVQDPACLQALCSSQDFFNLVNNEAARCTSLPLRSSQTIQPTSQPPSSPLSPSTVVSESPGTTGVQNTPPRASSITSTLQDSSSPMLSSTLQTITTPPITRVSVATPRMRGSEDPTSFPQTTDPPTQSILSTRQSGTLLPSTSLGPPISATSVSAIDGLSTLTPPTAMYSNSTDARTSESDPATHTPRSLIIGLAVVGGVIFSVMSALLFCRRLKRNLKRRRILVSMVPIQPAVMRTVTSPPSPFSPLDASRYRREGDYSPGVAAKDRSAVSFSHDEHGANDVSNPDLESPPSDDPHSPISPLGSGSDAPGRSYSTLANDGRCSQSDVLADPRNMISRDRPLPSRNRVLDAKVHPQEALHEHRASPGTQLVYSPAGSLDLHGGYVAPPPGLGVPERERLVRRAAAPSPRVPSSPPTTARELPALPGLVPPSADPETDESTLAGIPAPLRELFLTFLAATPPPATGTEGDTSDMDDSSEPLPAYTPRT